MQHRIRLESLSTENNIYSVNYEIGFDTSRITLHKIIADVTTFKSRVYTDEASAYLGMPDRYHFFVCHSDGEYVKGDVHTNGIESFWAKVKRTYFGIHHYISRKHMNLYLRALAGLQNMRTEDEIVRMERLALGMMGKRLRYADLVGAAA